MADILRVITLNCWALPFIWPVGSKDRKYRISKIIEALLDETYDIVSLQEIWSEKDYEFIRLSLESVYPYSFYFFSGFTGSGVCIFSRHAILSSLMHRYSLNGFAHHIHRGDWFGGKVVGMAEIQYRDYRLNFYTTHLHAEYNRQNDLYRPHRLSQALELSQFIKHTSNSADLIVLTGDLNIEPDDLGYRVIVFNANLRDAWLNKANGTVFDLGMTCDRPDNCYTVNLQSSIGKRIDYIMFRAINVKAYVSLCENRFGRIPDTDGLNYSDHIGVYAEFTIEQCDESVFFKDEQEGVRSVPEDVIVEVLKVLREGESRARWDSRLFIGVVIVLLILIVGSGAVEIYLPAWTALASVCRFLITLIMAFCLWYGIIGLRMERKALKAAISTMSLMINEHDH